MIDFNKFPMNKKPYSDGTLKCMAKENLIEYIRDIEHNYAALYTLYKNAVDANLEKFKDFERVIRCKDCKYYEVAELNYDGTPDKRCKPSVCTNGKYAVERPEDWYCGDAQARRNND